jgi:glycine oxidase
MTDVVVAGGGLIGLSVAWRCAQRGLDVVVIEAEGERGAGHAAAGMLAPVTEAAYGEEHLLRLCQASLRRYPAFAAELERASGIDVGLRTSGTLQVCFDADDQRMLDELHGFHVELGLPVERLTASQARSREPALTPRVRGAVLVPTDHSVDARRLRAALALAATAAGVRIVDAEVAALAVDHGRATGLRLQSGEVVNGDSVVLALGAWSGRLPSVPELPVRPVKGQVLRLRGAEGLITRTVRALVRGRNVYVVPVGSAEVIVGATVEELGFDPAATAGGVYGLLRDAIEVVPGITELELSEIVVRFRPGTPDNAPLLGPIGPGGPAGLVLATGHYRNGVLLTPVTGDAIATYLADGGLPPEASGFGPERFTTERGARR